MGDLYDDRYIAVWFCLTRGLPSKEWVWWLLSWLVGLALLPEVGALSWCWV